MFEEYNNMSVESMTKKTQKLLKQIEQFDFEIKKVDRIIKKPCWWTLIIPLFGLFIFNSMVNKRKINTNFGLQLAELKTNRMYLELEVKYIEQKIKNMSDSNGEDNNEKK